jgi:PAS domain S-box-containing protein
MQIFAFLSLISSIIVLSLGIFVYSTNRKRPLNQVFLCICMLAFSWTFMESMLRDAETLSAAYVWMKLTFLWIFLPATGFHFILLFTKSSLLRRGRWIYLLMYAPPALFALAELATGLIITTPVLKYWGYTYGYAPDPLPFLAELAWALGILVVSVFISIRYYLRAPEVREKNQTKYIIAGFSAIVIAGFMSELVFPAFQLQVPESETICFLFFSGMIGYAIQKHDLFVINPAMAADNIVSTMTDSLILLDTRSTIISVNTATLKILQCPEKELIGRPFSSLFSDPSGCEAILSTITGSGPVTDLETAYRSCGGQVIPISFSGSVIKNADGDVTGIVCISRDITRRKLLEESLRYQSDESKKCEAARSESERQYRTLFENSVLGIFRTTPEGAFSTINPTFARMAGYKTPEEMMEAIRDVRTQLYVNPSDRTIFTEKLVTDGFVKNHEAQFRHKDGHVLWITLNAIAVRDPGGKVRYFEGTIEDITEQKQAQEDLSETENRYRTIFENTGTAAILIEEDTLISLANAEFEHLSGYPREELEGKKSWTEFVLQEDLERMLARHRRRRETGEAALKQYEFRFVTKTGEIRMIFLTIDVIPGTKQSIASLMDITELKSAEEELRTSERKFRAIFDQSFQFIGLMTPDGTLVEANRTALEFGGIRDSDILGRPFWETPWWTHSKDLQEKLRAAIRDAAGGEFVRFEATHRAADGSLHYVDFSIKPVTDEAGRVVLLIPEGRDITGQKRSEDALRESEAKYRALTENIPDILFSTDMDGIITYASPQVNRYGYLEEEVIGKSLDVLVHPADIRQLESKMSAELEKGAQFVFRFRILDKWGNVYWCEEKSFLRLDLSAKPIGIYGILRDVTEGKRIEDAIEIANKKLNLMNQITRHDILNTITGLLGCVDMAKATTSPEQKDQLLSEIKELTRVIQRHIAFTREYQEVGVHIAQWQNVNELLRKVLQNFEKSGISFSTDFEKMEIYADPLLEKVFYNLVDNAIRYGETLTMISVYPAISDTGFSLVFEDDGAGVDPRQKKEIFKRGVGKNTGMGLFLTAEILAITGITIEENGIFGKGARFEIRIPNGTWRFPKG